MKHKKVGPSKKLPKKKKKASIMPLISKPKGKGRRLPGRDYTGRGI